MHALSRTFAMSHWRLPVWRVLLLLLCCLPVMKRML
jgi:hypothetical protein